ncbi:ABC transporter permease [Salinispora arenicola]|uniref:ABC transporter permease n=1 Tax=Salinispora arenicola TaxID=168697 RepID=UPI0003614A9A|nr:ABC transporter permease [Salinispora arenicola]
MSRILRIQLRRSVVPAALIVLLAGLVAMHSSTELWADGWMPLAIDQRYYLVFGWPLALAVGAWQARREHRAGVHELVASTARPRRLRVLPVLAALAIVVSAAYIGTSLTAVPRLNDATSYLPAATFTIIAVGALAVVAAAWLGMALGQLLPSAVTAPALGVAGIGLLIALPKISADKGQLIALFSPVISSGQYNELFTVPSRVSMAQAGWWLALALTAMVLLAAGRSRTRVAALLPLALGAATLTITQQNNDHPGVVADPAAQELVCADGIPRVCVARVRAFMLPEITAQARRGLAMLARLPEAPTTAIDAGSRWYTSTEPLEPDTVLFPVEISPDGRLSNFLPTMLHGGGAAACPDDRSWADYFADRAAAFWLMGEEPGDREDAQIHDLWQSLDALPDAEAVERVTALRDAARTCSGSRSQLLTGGRA